MIFWTASIFHYANSNKNIKFWSSHPTPSNEEKDVLYEAMWNRMGPKHKRLASYIGDPWLQNRKGVVANIGILT